MWLRLGSVACVLKNSDPLIKIIECLPETQGEFRYGIGESLKSSGVRFQQLFKCGGVRLQRVHN